MFYKSNIEILGFKMFSHSILFCQFDHNSVMKSVLIDKLITLNYLFKSLSINGNVENKTITANKSAY